MIMFASNFKHYVNGDANANTENGCTPILCIYVTVGTMLNLNIDANADGTFEQM